jgi:hypothetical protein
MTDPEYGRKHREPGPRNWSVPSAWIPEPDTPENIERRQRDLLENSVPKALTNPITPSPPINTVLIDRNRFRELARFVVAIYGDEDQTTTTANVALHMWAVLTGTPEDRALAYARTVAEL